MLSRLLFPFLLLSAVLHAGTVVVTGPTSSPRVSYALERLSAALEGSGHLLLANGKADLSITLNQDDSIKSEGYSLVSQKGAVTLRASDDSGRLYGLLDLSQRLAVTRDLSTFSVSATEAPALRLRGPCIGMQKTFILPGYHVYEYPYREDLFPFFYDKAGWVRYLDFLADNRMNSLYLWNGHPFASLVRLPEYPYALEVTEEQFAKNVEMFRFLAQEADRRGIWVVQMFYSIILSKPFAEHHGIETQLAAPVPIANDYMRKSIAAFVREYPNVGLMVCLGEALRGDENQIAWCNDVVLAGVKDGMREAGLTKEPPVVIRTHAMNPRLVMPEALKHYSNLFTEAKYNGESLTTWEPRGAWQSIHQDMAALGSTHIANVHILANLEPFRFGAQRFIHKSVLAMRDRLHAGGLHLYPLAYWSWPDAPDIAEKPLDQLDRDWIWFEAWARYAWNPDVDETADREYWLSRLQERFGTRAAAEALLDAYNDSGECAPRILRRFGITEGNRQTMSLGMTLDQLVNPGRYRPYAELWKSQAPEGERLDEFVDKEWNHISHVGETPVRIIEEIRSFSANAVARAEAAGPHVTKNHDEYLRILNDTRCIQAMSESYASKVLAAARILRFGYSEDLNDMDQALVHLKDSLTAFERLTDLTRHTYAFANTMQTSQRRIPVAGGRDGERINYHWTQLLPTYTQEYKDFEARVKGLHDGTIPVHAQAALPKFKKAAVRVLSKDAQLYHPSVGSHPFTDKEWEYQALASELSYLPSIRFSYEQAASGNYTPVEFECDTPVHVLVGYVQSKDKAWLQAPDMETDALAGENYVSEPLVINAAVIDGMPSVNIHVHRFPAGRNKLVVRGSGAFIVLGVVVAEGDGSPPVSAAPGSASQQAAAQASPAPSAAPVAVSSPKAVSTARYKVSACDWMMLKRQKLGAFQLAADIGADGLELDIGGLGSRELWDNKLRDPAQLSQFRDKASSLGLGLSSIALSGFYAQSFAERPNYEALLQEAIDLAVALKAPVIFLPLGVKGDLVKYPELRPVIIERLRVVGRLAEKQGVVIGIETALDSAGEVALLDEIGVPAVKSYFNFSNALEAGRDLLSELRLLGASRIAQIHATDKDGFLLKDNTRLDLPKVKALLDDMGWSGWLVIERSRDAKDPRNVRHNFSSNAAYLKQVFQP